MQLNRMRYISQGSMVGYQVKKMTNSLNLLVSLAVLACGKLATAQAVKPIKELTPVVVTGSQNLPIDAAAPAAIGEAARINLEQRPDATVQRVDELLIEEGYASWNASNSLGISTGLNVRGFASSNQGVSSLQVGRNFLNGHADLVWRFARDAATVSRVELVGGNDATLLGSGNPGAALQYVSKTPQGQEFIALGSSVGSNGLKRVVGDFERHFGPIQSRLSVALQRDAKTLEGVKDERDVLLLSNKLPWGTGSLRYDVEYHSLRQPFAFGTAYAGGRFLLDQPYVDARASAARTYRRHALYLEQAINDDTKLTAYLQQGKSHRDELLLGFYDVSSAKKLRGYYRLIDEDNQQNDAGLRVDGKFSVANTTHQWAAALQRMSLGRSFAGPQNIGGFSLDVDNPVFPRDLGSLALSSRYAFEHYSERGLGFADTIRSDSAPGWELRVGARRSQFDLDSTTALNTPLKRGVEAGYTSTSVALAKQLNEQHRVWLSRTGSFLPNRGKFSNGEFLPPSQSHQTELGWSMAADASRMSVALFSLKQNNLPAKDPLDPDALILIGGNRSEGAEVRFKTTAWGMSWQANVTALRARLQNPTSATQGTYLTGVADMYGSIKLSKNLKPAGLPVEVWARVQGASSLPGDNKASFRAPGYGVLDIGVQSKLAGDVQWGLQIGNVANRSYVRAMTGDDNVWQGPKRHVSLWVNWAI